MLLTLLLGQGTAGPQAYTLSVDPFSVAVTPANPRLLASRQLVVTPQSYNLTPVSNSLSVSRQLPVSATSYSVSFSPVTLVRSIALPVTATSLSLSFAGPVVQVARSLSVSPQSVSATFSPVSFRVTRTLNVSTGSASLTFANVSLDYTQQAKQILVDPFSVATTFASPSVSVSRKLSVSPSNLTSTFASASLRIDRKMTAQVGGYAILTAPVGLQVERKLNIEPAIGYSLSAEYAEDNYVIPNYVGDVGVSLTAQRQLAVSPSSIVISMASVSFVKIGSYPDQVDVRLGVQYGPGGAYTGTLVGISETSIQQLLDIWHRFGLDPNSPLVQTTNSVDCGFVLALSGTDTVTVVRSGQNTNSVPVQDAVQDLWQRLGLDDSNPLIVSKTSIVSGGVEQSILESGATTTVTRL